MDVTEQVLAFIVGVTSSVVVALMGFPSIKQYLQSRARKKNLQEVLKFWESSEAWNIVCCCEDSSMEEEPEPRVGYSEAYGMAEIKRLLQTIYPGRPINIHLTLLKEQQAIPRELFKENIVIMGGVRSLEQFGVLCRLLRLPYQSTNDGLYDRAFGSLQGNTITDPFYISEVDKDEQRVIRDFGIITRIVNPENSKLIVLFDGNFAAGLLAAVLVATSNARLTNTRFTAFLKPEIKATQIVLQVRGIIENMITLPEPDMSAVTPWTSFEIDRVALSTALNSISRRSVRFSDG